MKEWQITSGKVLNGKMLQKADIISLYDNIDLHKVVLFSRGYNHRFHYCVEQIIKICIIIYFTIKWNASSSFTVNYSVLMINGRTKLQLNYDT